MVSIWTQSAAVALGQEIISLSRLGGGDFAQAYRGTLADGGSVFIKTHSNPPAGFFSTEAAGLDWLRGSDSVNIPQIYAVSDSPALLVLQWVEAGPPTGSTEAQLGRMLARLHSVNQKEFGRPDARCTGSLGVPNSSCLRWSDFYASQRLLPLAAIACDRKSLPEKSIKAIERIAHNLAQLDVPVEPPALLHGDLWAGNRLVDHNGQSWLIDPAAHHGHREFDLAMMKLFGGFDAECFEAYHEVYALERGWKNRIKLHQLAPLVVHAIKFGGSYVQAVDEVVRTYA